MRIKLWVLILAAALPSTPAFAGARQERAKIAMQEWKDCVLSRSREFSSQPEPAETLATAAMGACMEQGQNFRVLLREATREYGIPFASTASPETLADASKDFDDKMRVLAVTEIVQARVKEH